VAPTDILQVLKRSFPSTPKYLSAILQFLHLLTAFYFNGLIFLSAVQEKLAAFVIIVEMLEKSEKKTVGGR